MKQGMGEYIFNMKNILPFTDSPNRPFNKRNYKF